MKLKTIRDRKACGSCLTVRLTKGEEFDYSKAEQLRTLQDGPFLPFSYKTEKDGTTVLTYDTSDTIGLGTYLGAPLSLKQFRALVIDAAHAVEACSDNGFSYTEFVFDHQYVYVDAETNHIKMAYIPATHLNSKNATIIDLLRYIATHTIFVCKEDQPCSECLLDFLKRQTIFSLVDFKAFIDSGELKGHTGDPTSLLKASDSLGQDEGEQEFAVLGASALGPAPPKASALGPGTSGSPSVEAGAYDFVKAQADVPSAGEARASMNLAEQVSFDVADVAPVPPCAPSEPFAGTDSPTLPVSASTSANPPVQGRLFIVRVSTGERYALSSARETTIGRSKRCDVHIGDNTNISRVHAIIEPSDNGCLVTDQGATNKTSVGGKELSPHMPRLAMPGDEILLADERFRLEAE